MESAVEAQQGVETAVTETESQQITPAQNATLAQVTEDVNISTAASGQSRFCKFGWDYSEEIL